MSYIIGVVFIFVIVFILIAFNRRYECFTNNLTLYNLRKGLRSQSSIDPDTSIREPIDERYLPVYVKMDESIYDTKYDTIILDIYKSVLDRQPTRWEILYYRDKFFTCEIDAHFLKIILYTNIEYENKYMLQSNEVQFGLERSVYVKELYILIQDLYKKYKSEPLDEILLPVLMNVMIHLRYDLYLFIAFLTYKGFDGFIKDIKLADIIDEFIEYKIFYKNVNIIEIKDIADNLKMKDISNGNAISIWSNIKQTPCTSITSIPQYNPVINNTQDNTTPPNNKTINIDINTIPPKFPIFAPNINFNAKSKDQWDKNKCRIYNPINYNTPDGRQSVCTSLGHDPIVQPVYIQSKTLYNGTDIEEANKMSVGYIMPKFKYKEYIDVECSIKK